MVDLDELMDLVAELERAIDVGDLGRIINAAQRLRVLVLEAALAPC